MAPGGSPWLHEEIGRRMEERLQWVNLKPERWVHWDPLRGGVKAHGLVSRRYPAAQCFAVGSESLSSPRASNQLLPRWWSPARWSGPSIEIGMPAQPVDLLWANMSLHMAADPQALIARWHQLLARNGFLMFSCLGPDTVRELHQIYAKHNWPPPSHAFTDMHDWGDMLLQAGFSQPVMDMEQITLTFASPERLLMELRELGRNLHRDRFPSLRGRRWREQLLGALRTAEPGETGGEAIRLTFEIVYGHAIKTHSGVPVEASSSISLGKMRDVLGMNQKGDSLQ
jgi:malonyl-CoA O-methyltransferase